MGSLSPAADFQCHKTVSSIGYIAILHKLPTAICKNPFPFILDKKPVSFIIV